MSQCLIIDSPSLLEEKGWVNGAVISGGCFKSSGLWPRFRDPPSVPAILSFKCTQCIYCRHLQCYFSSVLHRRLWIVMEWLESWGGTLGNANGNAHADNNTRFQQSQNDIPVTSMCSTMTSIFVASFDFDMYKFEMCLIDIWTTLRIVWLKFEKWWRPGQAFLWARAAFQTLGNTL